jgi:plasmid stabilization system protein ParE
MSTPRGAWWSLEQTAAALSARQQAADAAVAGLDPLANAVRIGTDVPAELADLDADSIRKLSMSSYAEIRRRAGLPPVDPYSDVYADFEPPTPQATLPAPEAVQANAAASQGIDVRSMGMDDYARLRAQLGIGQSPDQGIFGAPGRQAQIDATRAQAGRGALSNANVEQAPQLTGRQVRQDEHHDPRSLAQRFGTPGNLTQF